MLLKTFFMTLQNGGGKTRKDDELAEKSRYFGKRVLLFLEKRAASPLWTKRLLLVSVSLALGKGWGVRLLLTCHDVQDCYEVGNRNFLITVHIRIAGNFLACHCVQDCHSICDGDSTVDIHIALLADDCVTIVKIGAVNGDAFQTRAERAALRFGNNHASAKSQILDFENICRT